MSDQDKKLRGRTEKLKIQDNLPIRTVGIETQRERLNYSDQHQLRVLGFLLRCSPIQLMMTHH
jgi:hypothetical protein